MPTKDNLVMLRAGYAPAVRVAKVLEKSLISIHRMVESGHLKGVQEGRVLYVEVASLELHYSGNPPMLEAVRLLRRSAPKTAKVS